MVKALAGRTYQLALLIADHVLRNTSAGNNHAVKKNSEDGYQNLFLQEVFYSVAIGAHLHV